MAEQNPNPTPETDSIAERLPVAPIDRFLVPVKRFLHIEASSGVVLIACTVLALVLANSPWAKEFLALWKIPVDFSIGTFKISGDIGHLIITDGLMTIFFFVIGLEVKREIIAGELRDPNKALLPLIGAFGGAVVPAAVYLALQWGQPGQRGWAIPMATDIAFVVGFLALFGRYIPFGLKIFLLTLAIVDDIVAVLIIAIVFTEQIALGWLLWAGVGFVVTVSFNLIGVRSIPVYVVIGTFIWLGFLKAGIHPTVAGVLLGLLTPASAWIGHRTFIEVIREKLDQLTGYDKDDDKLPIDLEKLQFVAREAISPLHRLELGLHPWVAFGIMPLFALSNAGVPLEAAAITEPVAVAVAAGLAIGKPLGIGLLCFLAVQFGITKLPEKVTWPMLFGGACLAGIGFTMALFLNGLAFPEGEFAEKESAGKVGVLVGSLLSAVMGSLLLLWAIWQRGGVPVEPKPMAGK
jgi:NhaA family Na+:H+ antiporter